MHGRINAGSCRVVHIPETRLNFSPRPHCAGEEGADGGVGSQGERCAKKGGGGVGVVECHKATAVQGCLSLQGSTPLLS